MKKWIDLCIATGVIATMMSISPVHASSAKVTEGSSVGKYAKPGAPVDIHFISQNVDSGEKAEVKIDLLTSKNKGKMHVALKLDPALNVSDEKMETALQFDLSTQQEVYPVLLHVSAEEDGVYYIRLLVTIEGKGSRAFAVPVFVGEGRVKKLKSATQKSALGENLSVSKAVEYVEK